MRFSKFNYTLNLIWIIFFLFLFGCIKTESAGKKSASLENLEFKTPESIFYDQQNDYYLVSNINGSPLDEDDNGFISRLRPDGSQVNLKWIDGQDEEITLNAPKGMGTVDNKLFVADLNYVRVFDLNTGKKLKDIFIENSEFLNDITTSPAGTVYVSDSGRNNYGAIFSITPDYQVSTYYRKENLQKPNGLLFHNNQLWVVSQSSPELCNISEDHQKILFCSTPEAGMDGLIVLNDGSLVFSSWEGKTIYQIDKDKKVYSLYGNLNSPADLGYDSKRDLILVPVFMENRIIILPANNENRE